MSFDRSRRTAAAMLALLLLFCSMGQSSACRDPLPGQDLATQDNTYYVAPGGNDDNPGTILYPWRTIQKAANTLLAGDTVYIRAGTYPERVVPQNSGSAGSDITYAAYPGETVTIDGSGITLPDDLEGLFHIQSQSYIVVSGLRVINAGPHDNNAGILVLNASHVTVENNATYNTNSSGIGVWGSSNVTVDGNRVEEAGGGGYQECISVAGTDTFEVRNNEVLNCHKEGIDAKDGASNGQIYRNQVHHTQRVGIYVDAFENHTYDIAVYQNVVHDIQDNNGFAIGSEQGGLLENVWVYNNIAYNNRYVGLTLHDCCPGPDTHPVQNVTVVNNTFYNNGWTDWGGGIAVDNPDVQNVIIRNNIVSQNLYFQIAVNPGIPAQNIAIDHNLIDGYRGTENEIYGDDYVEGDPLFVDPSQADFHLQETSPAIDRGSAVDAPANDYDGSARPQDGDQSGTAEYDIGAYEVVAYSEHAYLPISLNNRQGVSSSWWKPPAGARFLAQVCPQAAAMQASAILKHRELDAWRQACR
jgi:parallel beta-helix repeat protein